MQVKQDSEVETDVQVGKTVTRAPCYMRTQLWLGVLQRYPGLGNKAARQYNSLLRKVKMETLNKGNTATPARARLHHHLLQLKSGCDHPDGILSAEHIRADSRRHCKGCRAHIPQYTKVGALHCFQARFQQRDCGSEDGSDHAHHTDIFNRGRE